MHSKGKKNPRRAKKKRKKKIVYKYTSTFTLTTTKAKQDQSKNEKKGDYNNKWQGNNFIRRKKIETRIHISRRGKRAEKRSKRRKKHTHTLWEYTHRK